MPAYFNHIPFHYQEDVAISERQQNEQHVSDGKYNIQDNGEKVTRYNVKGFMAGADADVQMHRLQSAQDGKSYDLIFPDGSTIKALLTRLQITRSVKSQNLIEFEAEFKTFKTIDVPQKRETKRERAQAAVRNAVAATGKRMEEEAAALRKKPSWVIDHVTKSVQDYLDKAQTVHDFLQDPLSDKFGSVLGDGLATAARFRRIFTPIQSWNATAINTLIAGFRITPANASAGRAATPAERGFVDAIQNIINQSLLQVVAEELTKPRAELIGSAREITELRENLTGGFRNQAALETGDLSEKQSDAARALGVYFVDEVQNLTILEPVTLTSWEAIRPFCFARYGKDDWRVAMAIISKSNYWEQFGVLLAGRTYMMPMKGWHA